MTAEKSSFVSEVEAAAAALLQHKHANDHGKSLTLVQLFSWRKWYFFSSLVNNSMTF